MPITAWNCPECKRVQPLDHYDSGGPCSLTIHPDFAQAVLDDHLDKADKAWPSVTQGLGCPRKSAILRSADVAVNPLDLNAPLTGTAWHKLVGQTGAWSELPVKGQIAGLTISGTIDRLRSLADNRVVIEDWKHTNDFSRKYLVDAKPEHVVQISLYAELVRQQLNLSPAAGIIWYHFASSPGLVPKAVELWPVERCLAYHPYDCDWSVGQLFEMVAEYDQQGGRWQDLPLVGQTIKFGGKTGCDYCEVRSTCLTAEGGAPF